MAITYVSDNVEWRHGLKYGSALRVAARDIVSDYYALESHVDASQHCTVTHNFPGIRLQRSLAISNL